jgi:hypothetical protein
LRTARCYPKSTRDYVASRREKLLRILIVVLLCLASAPIALAQSITAGAVSGITLDQSGRPVIGAVVELREAGTNLRWRRPVRTGGAFMFTYLAPGQYELFVEQIGYRPTRVVEIEVAPAADVRLTVRLNAAVPPVVTIDTVYQGRRGLHNGPGADQPIQGFAVTRLPATDRNVVEVARLSSQLSRDLGAEGLSSRGTLLAMNGVRHDVARHSYFPAGNLIGLAVPQGPLSRVDVLTAPLDMEWGDFTGAVVNATSRPGTGRFAFRGFGDWSGNPVTTSGVFDPGAVTFNSWRGGAVASGPVLPDTAFLIAAVEGQFERRPLPAGWIGGAGNATLAAAPSADSSGLTRLLAPRVASDDRLAGSLRLDWQLSERHRAMVSAAGGYSRQSEPQVGLLGIPTPGAELKATDVMADASVTSRMNTRIAHELRVGFERSEREYGSTGIPTAYLSTGERFGTDPALPAAFRRTGARLEDVLHLRLGSHELKIGLIGSLSTHHHALRFGQDGVYWFGDAAEFALGRGVFQGVSGRPSATSFSIPRFGALLQDQWTVTSGLELITAVRYDTEFLPDNEIPLNRNWLASTGINNQQIPSTVHAWSSRLGFLWRIGESAWLLRGGAGVYRDQVDPAVLGELAVESGTAVVRQAIGAVGGWPDGAATASATGIGARLALLGPGYQPPRSAKVSFGIARRLGASGVISVAANYRHTDFLIRRHDINLLSGQTGQDQYGRPIYGTLTKEGGLLAAAAGSNRRFSGFDLVSALDPDGSSDYRGMTVELHQSFGRLLQLNANYTWSATRDNWLSGSGGGPYAQLRPFPDSLNGQDWDHGRSDMDIPHRLELGAELWPFGRRGLSLGVRYGLRSGLPFTPGFRPGVDANGDGSATNDPAFIDETLPGMDALVAQWSCLARQIGSFAERNSCREPLASSLDLRIGVGPGRMAGFPVELWVEALNVMDEAFTVRDQALQVVNGAAALANNTATGDVSIPLLANGQFGQPLAYRAAGRLLRLQVRVGY